MEEERGAAVHEKGRPRSGQERGRWLRTKSPASGPGKQETRNRKVGQSPDRNSAAPTRRPCWSSDRKLFVLPDRAGIDSRVPGQCQPQTSGLKSVHLWDLGWHCCPSRHLSRCPELTQGLHLGYSGHYCPPTSLLM